MKNYFEKVSLAQIHCLCKLIEGSQIREKRLIKRRYSDSALNFEETITFLEHLRLLKCKSTKGSNTLQIVQTPHLIAEFKKCVLTKLLSSSGELSKQLHEFFCKFTYESENIIFRATIQEKLKFSAIRNLLLELDFMSIASNNKQYNVNSIYTDLFLHHLNQFPLTSSVFKIRQKEQESIGLAAERQIIDFEASRLTEIEFHKNEIEHVALKNISAGYDIRSFENYYDDHNNRIIRYIEVKAVSSSDYKFYWSKNEIEKAKILCDRYFLYLVPVKQKETFDLQKLLIISNPFHNVYLNVREWIKEEETVSLFKKQ